MNLILFGTLLRVFLSTFRFQDTVTAVRSGCRIVGAFGASALGGGIYNCP